MKLTRDDVLKMNQADLLNITTREQFHEFMNAVSREVKPDQSMRTAHDAELHEHMSTLLDPFAAPYVKEILEAFQTKQSNPQDLRDRFKNEPPLVRLHAWSQLTMNGVDKLELARYVHRHFAECILIIFSTPLSNN